MFEAEVVVQVGGKVLLHAEEELLLFRGAFGIAGRVALGFGSGAEIAFSVIFFEGSGRLCHVESVTGAARLAERRLLL